MKPPKGVEDMAERLRTAATTPALTLVARPASDSPSEQLEKPAKATRAEKPSTARRVKGDGASVSVFLRVPPQKHAELEAEAMKRTKATGKGVTVQQIILERI